MPTALTASLAERFAAIALGHVEREYPNKPGHVLDGPEDAGRGITCEHWLASFALLALDETGTTR